MTLERAYINCKRCYELRHSDSTGRREKHNVRNEAMKALEGYNNEPITIIRKREKLVRKALMRCRKCDFKSAGIVDLIESIEKAEKGK